MKFIYFKLNMFSWELYLEHVDGLILMESTERVARFEPLHCFHIYPALYNHYEHSDKEDKLKTLLVNAGQGWCNMKFTAPFLHQYF